MELILASQSPRRKELLSKLGYPFNTIPAYSQEYFDKNLDVDSALEKIALDKAIEVAKAHPEDWILAADTVVLFEGEILGKPQSKAEACEMLLDLSGHWHEVKTAVAILAPKFQVTFTKTSKVHFRGLTDKEILDYAESGKPLDKAGAYGIQEVDFVDEIIGDYDNVVGLPTEDVSRALKLIKMMDKTVEPSYFYPKTTEL